MKSGGAWDGVGKLRRDMLGAAGNDSHDKRNLKIFHEYSTEFAKGITMIT
jgi:hypothetical protein